jgi:hypothetical protein
VSLSTSEALEEVKRLSALLDAGLAYLREQAREYAAAEDAYRMAHAKAYLAAEGPAHLRKAAADLATSSERVAAHVADGMRNAAVEAVRSRRSQLSAIQSILAAQRAEADMGRFGPEVSP